MISEQTNINNIQNPQHIVLGNKKNLLTEKKLRYKHVDTFYPNEEKELLRKLDLYQNELNEIVIAKKLEISSIIDYEKSKLEKIKNSLKLYEQNNSILKNKLIEKENKIENFQNNFINKENQNLINIYNQILIIRKTNFKDFDTRINFFSTNDRVINRLKKELYLYMNFLKLRILKNDLNNKENENSNELAKKNNNDDCFEGYFLNLEENYLKNIKIKKDLNDNTKAVIFWSSFVECFKSKKSENIIKK